MKKMRYILIAILIIVAIAYTINPTQFSMLYVGSKPSGRSHTLSLGQSEFDGTAYFDGAVTLGNATTDNTTITGVLTLSSAIYGANVFTTLKTVDTVAVAGTTTACRIIVRPYGATVVASDVLSGVAGTDSIFIYRATAIGTDLLTYFYVSVR